jgi:hypothetical protein
MTKEEYKNEIKKQYAKLDGIIKSKQKEYWNIEWERHEKTRSTCPSCQSKNVTSDFKNVNGKIDGSMSGSWGLFGGSMSGSVHGKIDTDKTFTCEKCKHTWKPYEIDYLSDSDILESELWDFYKYIDDIDDKEVFDKNDPSEKYNSLEEKQKAYIARTEKEYNPKEHWLREFFPDTIRWAVKNSWFKYDFYKKIADWDDKKFARWGFTMPPREATKQWWEFWI